MVIERVVVYVNPVTNSKEEIVSHAYASNPKNYLKEGRVKVHYAPDGKVWINLE